ncbi:STAS domain-containing protein [Streptosporangium sp. NPDC023825]|uniref:STAS domain-containing protein n=1 Tax=Streptosporangium sp. NPDC023825 TaxID=3154909 RepID=UPI0034424C80
MSELRVATRDTGTGPVLEVAGELDFRTASRLREALRSVAPLPGQRLVIDLAGLTACDSSGITVLLVARNRALEARAGIVLAAVPDRLARVFRIVGLDQVFAVSHPAGTDVPDPRARADPDAADPDSTGLDPAAADDAAADAAADATASRRRTDG